MILEYRLPLNKEEFCISKLNSIDYKCNIGNFVRHLKTYNFTYDQYINEYYYNFLPKSLETGNVVNNKISGYWNLYIPLEEEFKVLHYKVKCISLAINRIKTQQPQFFTKYLSFEYWIKSGIKLSEAYNKINFFLYGNRDVCYYKFLSDFYYDGSWSQKCKNDMINNILNLKEVNVYRSNSKLGQYQRKYDIFATKLPKEPKKARISYRESSVRCIEYWLRKNYTLEEAVQKISDLQKLNSIDNIKTRYNCSFIEAKDIQKEIYLKRLKTIYSKSNNELQNIHKSQNSGNFEYCLRKMNYDYLAAKKLYLELKEKRTNIVPFGKASKESLKLFIPLYKYLRKNNILREDIYFGISGSNEYFLRSMKDKLFCKYDFTILSHKLIIEYDGIYWHNDKEKDFIKENLAKTNGFKVLRICSTLEHNEKITIIKNFIDENIQITNTNW